MIAEVNKLGMIILESQTLKEKEILQDFVGRMANDSAGFMDCCRRKNCAFEIELKESE